MNQFVLFSPNTENTIVQFLHSLCNNNKNNCGVDFILNMPTTHIIFQFQRIHMIFYQ